MIVENFLDKTRMYYQGIENGNSLPNGTGEVVIIHAWTFYYHDSFVPAEPIYFDKDKPLIVSLCCKKKKKLIFPN
jgi:hypothetical protein